MKKKPPLAKTTTEPTITKHATVRFSIGSLTQAKHGRVIHTGKLWSKEVEG
jgi:hypothetical protein